MEQLVKEVTDWGKAHETEDFRVECTSGREDGGKFVLECTLHMDGEASVFVLSSSRGYSDRFPADAAVRVD
jgi:hypothetical protein